MNKAILKRVARAVAFTKPLFEALFSLEARISEAWVAGAHRRLYLAQWGLPPVAEHFTHKIDLYAGWQNSRNPLWVERGVYSSLALKSDCDVLDICCGDGFYAHFFFSIRAKSVLSVDFNPKAIAYAKRNFRAPNVTYRVADIRTDMPTGDFHNVVWDAAIEHFTEAEILSLLAEIKQRLSARDGVLSGYTIVESPDHRKQHPEHECEFESKEQLETLLRKVFANVTVFETIYPSRHNLYFWASDSLVPFMKGWQDHRNTLLGLARCT